MDIFETPAYKSYKDLIKGNDDQLETPEEKDAFRHVLQMQEERTHDYDGPLYSPHPDLLKNDD